MVHLDSGLRSRCFSWHRFQPMLATLGVTIGATGRRREKRADAGVLRPRSTLLNPAFARRPWPGLASRGGYTGVSVECALVKDRLKRRCPARLARDRNPLEDRPVVRLFRAPL